jgi:hypothetical protein
MWRTPLGNSAGIIVLGGYQRDSDKVKVAGIDDHVLKPISMVMLRRF